MRRISCLPPDQRGICPARCSHELLREIEPESSCSACRSARPPSRRRVGAERRRPRAARRPGASLPCSHACSCSRWPERRVADLDERQRAQPRRGRARRSTGTRASSGWPLILRAGLHRPRTPRAPRARRRVEKRVRPRCSSRGPLKLVLEKQRAGVHDAGARRRAAWLRPAPRDRRRSGLRSAACWALRKAAARVGHADRLHAASRRLHSFRGRSSRRSRRRCVCVEADDHLSFKTFGFCWAARLRTVNGSKRAPSPRTGSTR